MKSRKNQNASSQFNTNEDPCEISSDKLGEIFRKYHPMEANKSLKVDDEYMKRFEKLFGAVAK